MPPRRHYHKWKCSICGQHVSTSSVNPGYKCASCRRSLGLAVSGAAGNGYTALTIAPLPHFEIGRCQGPCGRDDQLLSNGLCECCRFYNIEEVDPELSARARKAHPGTNDFTRTFHQ